MKFLCLAYEEQAVLDALDRTEWDALRSETLAYLEILEKGGHLVRAEPLQSARTAATLQVRGGRLAVVDGPFADTKEQLGGFFLIEARDRAEAIALAARWPSARLGSIEVRPIEEGLPEERRYRATAMEAAAGDRAFARRDGRDERDDGDQGGAR
jgi:hypothetical protein